jgi:hypothetical protein
MPHISTFNILQDNHVNESFKVLPQKLGTAGVSMLAIRALSAHSAAEFNSSPGRWQQVWLVALYYTTLKIMLVLFH